MANDYRCHRSHCVAPPNKCTCLPNSPSFSFACTQVGICLFSHVLPRNTVFPNYMLFVPLQHLGWQESWRQVYTLLHADLAYSNPLGFRGNPKHTCRGQSPAKTRKRLDFPEPFGPITIMLLPGGTSKVSSLTSFVPSGELRATLHDKRIHSPFSRPAL